MGFNVIHREVQTCYCEKPAVGFKNGDVIQCDECNQYWRCIDSSPRVLQWEKVRKLWSERSQTTVWEAMK